MQSITRLQAAVKHTRARYGPNSRPYLDARIALERAIMRQAKTYRLMEV